MSKIKFNLTPQEHIKEIKECGEKFTGSQYYCLYKEDIEKLVKYSEKRDKEIERLNNIINELENHCETMLSIFEQMTNEDKQKELHKYLIYDDFLTRLKRLKGDSSDE